MWLRSLILLAWSVPALAGTATLNWTPPTTRTDGSALTDLAGYKLYERCGAGSYGAPISIPAPASSYVREPLADGTTCYWQLTAFDAAGIESARTAEVSRTFPLTALEQSSGFSVTWQAQAEPPTGPPDMALIYAGGGNSSSFGDGETSSGWQPQNFAYGGHIEIAEAGTVTQMGVYGRDSNVVAGGPDLKFALYDSAGNLVAQSTASDVSNTALAWVDSGAVAGSVSAGTYYVLVSAETNDWFFGYDTAGDGTYASRAFGSFPADPEALEIEAESGLLYGVRVDFTAGGSGQTADLTQEAGLGVSFDGTIGTSSSLTAGIAASAGISAQGAAQADFSAGAVVGETAAGINRIAAAITSSIDLTHTAVAVAGSIGTLEASVDIAATSTAAAAASATFAAEIIAAQETVAQAAATGRLAAGVGLSEAPASITSILASIAAGLDADVTIAAVSQASSAIAAGLAAGESWASNAQAAAALAAAGEFGAQFLAESQAAQAGALAAPTTHSASFLSAAQALAQVSATAGLTEAVAGLATALGSMTAGTSLGVSFAYLAGNSVSWAEGADLTSVMQIAAAASAALVSGIELTELVTAQAVSAAVFQSGASFGDSFSAIGGLSSVLPPANRSLVVSLPSRRLAVVLPDRTHRVQ